MSRRTALPGASELFRSTGQPVPGSRRRPTPAPESAEDQQLHVPSSAERLLAETSTDARAHDLVRPGGGDGAAGPTGAAGPAGAAPGAPARTRATRPGAPRRASDPTDTPTGRTPGRGAGVSSPTGRERHDEKITVYVSGEELLDLERARLTLRGEHGLAVDRGRIVREALAVVLADLEAEGETSTLVQRLRSS